MRKLILTIRLTNSHIVIEPRWTLEVELAPHFEYPIPADFQFNLGRQKELELRSAGSRLFEAIFQGEVKEIYRSQVRWAQEHSDSLHLNLVLDETSLHLPWELMYDHENTVGFLALDSMLSIIRVEKGTRSPSSSKATLRELPVRILHVIAMPSDHPDFRPSSLPTSLDYLLKRGLVTVDEIRGPDTLGQLNEKSLQERILGHPYSILIIEAHGDNKRNVGEIFLCSPQNWENLIKPPSLASALGSFQGLQVAILNCCQTAEVQSKFKYASLPRTLIGGGVPVVFAMNDYVVDENANYFFKAILENIVYSERPIALAATSTRQAMQAQNGYEHSQFFVPTLYAALDANTVFGIPFDPSRVNTKVLNIRETDTIQILKPVEVPTSAEVEIDVLNVSRMDEYLVFEIEARLKYQDQDKVIDLGNEPVLCLTDKSRIPTELSYGLRVSNQKPLVQKLKFKFSDPTYIHQASLEFNQNSLNNPLAPHIIVENIPLPLHANQTAENASTKTLGQYSDAALRSFLEQCRTSDGFVQFCLGSQENWKQGEAWLFGNTLVIWATSYLLDAELADNLKRIVGEHITHRLSTLTICQADFLAV